MEVPAAVAQIRDSISVRRVFGGKVRWRPALDVTSIILRAQAGLIVLLVLLLRRR